MISKYRTLSLVVVAALLSALLLGTSSRPAEAAELPEREQQIHRLYWVTLGRSGDPAGVRDWTQRMIDGESLERIALRMVLSKEGRAKAPAGTSFSRNAYVWALGREPGPIDAVVWKGVPETEVLVAVANSPEHRALFAARPQPDAVATDLTPTPTHPAGWVNAGHGVYVPPVLLEIRRCESGGNYKAVNGSSGASGAYQFLRSSWAAYGHNTRFGTSTGAAATPAQQDEAAVITFQRSGTRPWLASQHCWR